MMKILLKILVAPFALALSLLAALLVFLFDICAFLLTIASVILAVLGINVVNLSRHYPLCITDLPVCKTHSLFRDVQISF